MNIDLFQLYTKKLKTDSTKNAIVYHMSCQIRLIYKHLCHYLYC